MLIYDTVKLNFHNIPSITDYKAANTTSPSFKQPQQTPSYHVSTGGIVGIVIGSVIFLLAFLALAAYMRRRKRLRRPETRNRDSKTAELSSRLSTMGELHHDERLPELHPDALQELPARAIHQLE